MDTVRIFCRLWLLVIGMFAAVGTSTAVGQARNPTVPSLPENRDPSTTIHIALQTVQQLLKAGEEISLSAKADRDCHLTVLHFGGSGKVTVLWPNAGSGWDGKVRAGQSVNVPGPRADFKIVVDGTSPVERIAAYATVDKDGILPQSDFQVTPDAKVKIFRGTVQELALSFHDRVARFPRTQRWGTAESAVRVASTTRVAAVDNDPCQAAVELTEVTSRSGTKKGYTARDFGEKSLEEMEHVMISEPSEGRLGSGRIESVSGFMPYSRHNLAFKSQQVDLERFDIKDPDLPKSVCGQDSRVRQSPCTDVPWRWSCSLIITWPDGNRSIGTGWLIGPRTVMTAGHCVYNHELKAWPKEIEVSPGTDGQKRPYGAQISTDFRSVDKWVEHADPTYDLGAVILPNDKLGKELGYFGFQALSTQSLKEAELNTAGYPGDKPRGTLWFMAGPVSSVDCGEIGYMIDTYGGQSGSPVWVKVDNKRVAVGIHVRGGCPNKATRIRKPIFDMMMHWKERGND